MDLKIDLVGGVQIKKALDDLQKDIKRKEEVALNKAAQFITVAIKDRTAKGIGVNKQGRRKEFEPYSDAYLKFLVSKRNKENASSRVNLLFSGLMLANLQPKKTGTFSRRIFFPNGFASLLSSTQILESREIFWNFIGRLRSVPEKSSLNLTL